ncbi:MAG: phospholipase A, partial [Proteobacteria bacterium]|nr:phospholipase A [Pseudomonadota bacterium]
AVAFDGVAEVRDNLDKMSSVLVAQAAAPAQPEGAVSRRLEAEQAVQKSPWAITPHRPNYILPYTYSFNPNTKPLKEAGSDDTNLDNAEVKFQISFKLPAWEQILGSNASLYFAYTQISLWQMYNENSAPFRDTNYEPEGFVQFDTDYDLLGLKNRAIGLGFVHQSNGRGLDAFSRSWNRLYANFVFERGNFAGALKPWWRIPEDKKEPGESDGDDNPNIERYLGYGELRAGYKWGNMVFAMMLRNNLRTDQNKGAIQLDWSFPLTSKLKGYVQFFNGYGESLIDYDHANQRIGVGVLLSDWL